MLSITEEFNVWCNSRYPTTYNEKEVRRQFDEFYQMQMLTQGFAVALSDLAFEIHQLQVCVEGLIEDNFG